MPKFLRVSFSDADYEVPVDVIARDRAIHYASDFEDGDIGRSFKEDTEPLFEEFPLEIIDWAVNNMHWVELAPYAIEVRRTRPPIDRQTEWMECDKRVVSTPGIPVEEKGASA